MRETEIRLPEALLLIGDPDSGRTPDRMTEIVTATQSCIAIGTVPGADSPTTVRVLGPTDPDPGRIPDYAVLLSVHSKSISVFAPGGDALIAEPVRTRDPVIVHIWLDPLNEPSSVTIRLDRIVDRD